MTLYKRLLTFVRRDSLILPDFFCFIIENFFYSISFILFGSEARGDARPDSDIDLLILIDTDDIFEKETHQLKLSLYDIELDSGVIINPIVRLKKEWGKIKTPLYMNIQQEGILL